MCVCVLMYTCINGHDPPTRGSFSPSTNVEFMLTSQLLSFQSFCRTNGGSGFPKLLSSVVANRITTEVLEK